MKAPPPTSTDAIAAALSQQWKEAIRINSQLTKLDSQNIEAYNRLGYAYLKTGQLLSAKRCFNKVLSLDRYNQIANKNLKKITTPKRSNATISVSSILSPFMFLEDPGKTKMVACINLAPTKVLGMLTSGQEVFLKAKRFTIEVRDAGGTYLGALPDDVSFKLIKFIGGGNRYRAIIKGASKNNLVIFLRELSRGKRYEHQPSFTYSTSYVPFSKNESALGVVEKPDTTATGEEAEEESVES